MQTLVGPTFTPLLQVQENLENLSLIKKYDIPNLFYINCQRINLKNSYLDPYLNLLKFPLGDIAIPFMFIPPLTSLISMTTYRYVLFSCLSLLVRKCSFNGFRLVQNEN